MIHGASKLPIGWATTNLETVVDVLDGLRVPVNARERAERLGNIPYYGATGQVGWIDDFLFDDTIILLGEDGAPFFDKTRNVAYLVSGKSWVNNHAHVLRAAKEIDSSFLRHQLNAVDYHPFVSGTTRWKLNQAPMRQIPLKIPPAAEQSRIADMLDEVFSDLDFAIRDLSSVQKKLALYRASILKAGLEGKLTAEWRAQHPNLEPASDLLKRILVERCCRWEEDQLRKFKEQGKEPPKNWRSRYKEPVAPTVESSEQQPEGWYWATLDQLLWQLRSGTAETSGKVPTDYPVLKSSAVRPGRIDFQELNFLDASQSRYRENFLEPGDFLITRLSGSVEYVGCSAVVEDIPSSGIQYPDRIFCGKLVFRELGVYLSYCFQHARIRKTLENSAKSTAGHQRISMSDLYPLVIALPPRDELTVIVETVEHQLSIINHIEADLDSRLKAAKSFRQSILRHAFEGKLVPQDPSDEPASELLKRIAIEREERAREAAAAKAATTKSKKPRKRPKSCEDLKNSLNQEIRH